MYESGFESAHLDLQSLQSISLTASLQLVKNCKLIQLHHTIRVVSLGKAALKDTSKYKT